MRGRARRREFITAVVRPSAHFSAQRRANSAHALAPPRAHQHLCRRPAIRPGFAHRIAPFAFDLGTPRGGQAFSLETAATRATPRRRPRIAVKDLVPPALPCRGPYAGDAAVNAGEFLVDVVTAFDEGRHSAGA